MLHLDVVTRKDADVVSRTSLLRREGALRAISIGYKMFGADIPERPPSMDGFVFAIILHAMKRAQALRVHGPMTREALCNLEEFQRAWQLWRPDVYRHIDIVPDAVIERVPAPGHKAISAFSGGLDATFTALRHRLKLAGRGSYDLTSVLMVQGFDIGIENHDYFRKAVGRSRPLIERLGLDMRFITTDSQNPLLQDWEDSHAAELACCLHQFADEFQFGLIGSTKPYNALVLPYGSNPATDHLLSGGGFAVVHDGAGFSRTAKAEVVSQYDFAVSQLRVCYQGKLQYRNCGRCEKCMRTYLNFLAAGNARPTCFDTPPDLSRVASIRTHNDAQVAELVSIVEHARHKGIEGRWLDDLQLAIDAYRPSSRLRSTLARSSRRAKHIMIGGLERLGLKRPVKAFMHRLYERYRPRPRREHISYLNVAVAILALFAADGCLASEPGEWASIQRSQP